jgi:PKD repeat protein
VVWQDDQDAHEEHHGGALNFGADGKLYIATGEHFDAPLAQSLSSYRGKLLRFNPDGTVPTDNPFHDGAGPNKDAIWALGLRNPYRAFYDAPSGRIFIGDVGGNDFNTAVEELNLAARGANYGWPDCEGPCSDTRYTDPLYSYRHDGRDAAITGGFVYRGTQFPSEYQGHYFFGDYAQNWIKRLALGPSGNVTGVFNFEPASGALDGPTGDIVYMTQGPDGALYYVDLGFSDVTDITGISKIRRISFVSGNAPPVAVASATPSNGLPPLSVAFSSSGSLDPEGLALSFSWNFGDATSSTQANPTHVYAARGRYVARLSVSDGVNTRLADPLTIDVGARPLAAILAPASGRLFRAGETVAFEGDAVDDEDGTLPASAFSWQTNFRHSTHVHPGVPTSGSKTGSLSIPTSGHDFSGTTWYEIALTVTDSHGLQDSKSVSVYPDKVNVNFASVPSGLTIYLDGLPRTTPFVHDTLIGFQHVIEAPSQTLGSFNYAFASWSDGGSAQHAITVPASSQSVTATFTQTSVSLPSGLVAAYNFNETTGASAADRSGNNNTLTLFNGPTRTPGRYGNALVFDGSDDYLSASNSSSLNIAGTGLTLALWISPQPSGADTVVIGKFWNATGMADPFYQYGLELTGGVDPHLFIGTSAGVVSAAMGSPLTFGQWTHLAVTFDGTSARFYVNGALVATQPLAASIVARGNPLGIGADNRPEQLYVGLLDELRIYQRALTLAEVQADMTTAF